MPEKLQRDEIKKHTHGTVSRRVLGTPKSQTRSRAQMLVHGNMKFDTVIGILILAYSALIGFETQIRLEGKDPQYLFWCETFFLICFMGEIILRWISDGMRNFQSGWFWFDLTLVVTGVVCTWILEPIIRATSSQDGQNPVSRFLALRVFRLMRLARVVRQMEKFKDLWKLCSGLVTSMRTMLSVCLLVFIAIFTFACLGIDLITRSEVLNSNEETLELVQDHFSSLPKFMLTLMRFANADSIHSIYVPIIRELPALSLYFLSLWLVVTVALMNLVTAIIVENAMVAGREDDEQKQISMRRRLTKILPQVKLAFSLLDSDNDGKLSIAEIEEAASLGTLALPREIQDFVRPDRLLDVFEFLDVDNSGDLSVTEFIDGVCCLALSGVPLETTQTLQLLRQIHEISVSTHTAILGKMTHSVAPKSVKRGSFSVRVA